MYPSDFDREDERQQHLAAIDLDTLTFDWFGVTQRRYRSLKPVGQVVVTYPNAIIAKIETCGLASVFDIMASVGTGRVKIVDRQACEESIA